ncbi:hypothetical protein [Nitrosopumilus ureiphilus]|nr:hypothetical protein [Nitrosopumilus ureiphilus]
MGEPQPQTSAKATLRLDEAGRSHDALASGSSRTRLNTNFVHNKHGK